MLPFLQEPDVGKKCHNWLSVRPVGARFKGKKFPDLSGSEENIAKCKGIIVK